MIQNENTEFTTLLIAYALVSVILLWGAIEELCNPIKGAQISKRNTFKHIVGVTFFWPIITVQKFIFKQ